MRLYKLLSNKFTFFSHTNSTDGKLVSKLKVVFKKRKEKKEIADEKKIVLLKKKIFLNQPRKVPFLDLSNALPLKNLSKEQSYPWLP